MIEAFRDFDIVILSTRARNSLQFSSTVIHIISGAAARLGFAQPAVNLGDFADPDVSHVSTTFEEENR